MWVGWLPGDPPEGRVPKRGRCQSRRQPTLAGPAGRADGLLLTTVEIERGAVDFLSSQRYTTSTIRLDPHEKAARTETRKAGRPNPLSSPVGGLGNFTEQALLVLASLAAGPKHGYAIARDVRALTGIVIGPGTLYVVIARLERQGWVRRLPADGRRQPYALTIAGADALRAESSQLQTFAETLVRRAALA